MISPEHLSNNDKNKVTKKTSWHGNILNAVKKNLSRLLSSQADPARENWT